MISMRRFENCENSNSTSNCKPKLTLNSTRFYYTILCLLILNTILIYVSIPTTTSISIQPKELKTDNDVHDILKDFYESSKSTPRYSPNSTRLDSFQTEAIGLFSKSKLLSRLHTRPPQYAHKFAFIYALNGDSHALEFIAGCCALHFSQTKYPIYALVSDLSETVDQMLRALGISMIYVIWEHEIPFLSGTPLSKGFRRARAFKLNIFMLEEFFEYGLFMDSDTLIVQNSDDEIDKYLKNQIEFASAPNALDWCYTTNLIWFKPSFRVYRQLLIRAYLSNACMRCSQDDQMIISAQFDPELYPERVEMRLNNKMLKSSLHWKYKRNVLNTISIVPKFINTTVDANLSPDYIMTQSEPKECVNYWNTMVSNAALNSETFECVSTTCYRLMLHLLQGGSEDTFDSSKVLIRNVQLTLVT